MYLIGSPGREMKVSLLMGLAFNAAGVMFHSTPRLYNWLEGHRKIVAGRTMAYYTCPDR